MRSSALARILLVVLAANAWACELLLGIEAGEPTGAAGGPSAGGGGVGASGGAPGAGGADGGSGAMAPGVGGGGSPASYAELILSGEPVAYWRLDDASGSAAAANATINPYDGTYNGGLQLEQPSLITELNASALFEGNGDVDVGNHLPFAERAPFTVEAWVRPTDGGLSEMVSKSNAGGGWRLFVSANDTQFRREVPLNAQLAIGARLQEGVTSYVVGRYDGAMVCLFVDGAEIQCKASTLSLPNGNARLLLGSSLVGWLDEVAIYPRALTDDEILEHYQFGTHAVR